MKPALLLAVALGIVAPAQAWSDEHESTARIEQTVRAFTLQQARNFGGTPRVTVTPVDSRLQLAHCDKPLETFLAPGAKPVGRTSIAVRCPGANPWSIFVQVEVRIAADVLVATHPLARGVPLTADDFTVQHQDLTVVAAGALSDPTKVLGQRLRYPVAAGAILNTGLLERTPIVKRGQTVTVVSGRNGFEVRQSAQAQADAAAGDTLRVLNPLTHRVVEGTVEADGSVRVPL